MRIHGKVKITIFEKDRQYWLSLGQIKYQLQTCISFEPNELESSACAQIEALRILSRDSSLVILRPVADQWKSMKTACLQFS